MTPLYLFELKLGSKQPSCSSYSVTAIQLAVMGVVHRERGEGGREFIFHNRQIHSIVYNTLFLKICLTKINHSYKKYARSSL